MSKKGFYITDSEGKKKATEFMQTGRPTKVLEQLKVDGVPLSVTKNSIIELYDNNWNLVKNFGLPPDAWTGRLLGMEDELLLPYQLNGGPFGVGGKSFIPRLHETGSVIWNSFGSTFLQWQKNWQDSLTMQGRWTRTRGKIFKTSDRLIGEPNWMAQYPSQSATTITSGLGKTAYFFIEAVGAGGNGFYFDETKTLGGGGGGYALLFVKMETGDSLVIQLAQPQLEFEDGELLYPIVPTTDGGAHTLIRLSDAAGHLKGKITLTNGTSADGLGFMWGLGGQIDNDNSSFHDDFYLLKTVAGGNGGRYGYTIPALHGGSVDARVNMRVNDTKKTYGQVFKVFPKFKVELWWLATGGATGMREVRNTVGTESALYGVGGSTYFTADNYEKVLRGAPGAIKIYY